MPSCALRSQEVGGVTSSRQRNLIPQTFARGRISSRLSKGGTVSAVGAADPSTEYISGLRFLSSRREERCGRK